MNPVKRLPPEMRMHENLAQIRNHVDEMHKLINGTSRSSSDDDGEFDPDVEALFQDEGYRESVLTEFCNLSRTLEAAVIRRGKQL